MGWLDSLRGSIVGLDTVPLIYFTEENPAYLKVVDPFFKAIEHGNFTVITSIVTLLEALVLPIRTGDLELTQKYRNFLLDSENVSTILLSQEIAEEAARLRAFHKIRTPDSIQVATAITMEAAFLLTKDKHLPSLPNLKILMLDDLLKEGQEKES